MLIYRCDLCKTTEIPEGYQLKLGNPKLIALKEITFWDLCKSCEEKIKDQLGPGRKYV